MRSFSNTLQGTTKFLTRQKAIRFSQKQKKEQNPKKEKNDNILFITTQEMTQFFRKHYRE